MTPATHGAHTVHTTTGRAHPHSHYRATRLARVPGQATRPRYGAGSPIGVAGQPLPASRPAFGLRSGSAGRPVYATQPGPVRQTVSTAYPPAATGPSTFTTNTVYGQTPGCATSPGATTAKRPCHTCGTSSKGCTTLSRFAFNSAELSSPHRSQLRELAERILAQNSNAVIATGHTDSSGTEDYNEKLGARRASTVIRELRKQLALLKPGAQHSLFWRIRSKGETRPVSDSDDTANRRVSICVRKATFSK